MLNTLLESGVKLYEKLFGEYTGKLHAYSDIGTIAGSGLGAALGYGAGLLLFGPSLAPMTALAGAGFGALIGPFVGQNLALKERGDEYRKNTGTDLKLNRTRTIGMVVGSIIGAISGFMVGGQLAFLMPMMFSLLGGGLGMLIGTKIGSVEENPVADSVYRQNSRVQQPEYSHTLVSPQNNLPAHKVEDEHSR